MRWAIRAGSFVTGGERHDCPQAQALLEGLHAHAVLADKGSEADALVKWSHQTAGPWW